MGLILLGIENDREVLLWWTCGWSHPGHILEGLSPPEPEYLPFRFTCCSIRALAGRRTSAAGIESGGLNLGLLARLCHRHQRDCEMQIPGLRVYGVV